MAGIRGHTTTSAVSLVMPGPRTSAAASAGQTGWRLTLLGGFGLHVGEDAVLLAPNPQRLVALLGLHEGSLRRNYVAGLLWGDSTEARANGSLRSALWKLQMACSEVVWNRGGTLRLSPDVDVDIRQGTTLARSVCPPPSAPDGRPR